MENTIFINIKEKYGTMPKVFKKISDYIMENYVNLSFMSISEVASKIDVSAGSITRYCKEMGYSGYQEFLQEIKTMVKKEIAPLGAIKEAISEPIEDNVLKHVIEMNIDILKKTYSDELRSHFANAVKYIRAARNIYIIGLRTAFAPAFYLYFSLSGFMDNVKLLMPGYQDIYDHIMNIDYSDVLISIGFERYTKLTCDITSYFKKHNCKVISITDSYSSPLAIDSSEVLIAKNSEDNFSYVSVMAIANALVISVGKFDKYSSINILENKQDLLIENGIHFNPNPGK